MAEWQGEDDPRRAITVADLLHMSSGLAFDRLPVQEKTAANHHFRVYFGAIDAASFSVSRPGADAPGAVWRCRNCDPLILGLILRRAAQAHGEDPLLFPCKALFEPVGMHSAVLEPDPHGNFLLMGYDYATARDWGRLGLLHLQEGVWEGERLLPEGWTAFESAPAPGMRCSCTWAWTRTRPPSA